jgi:hypothetical protein
LIKGGEVDNLKIGGGVMQTAKIVKILDNGSNIQVLCADERGLLSVYFEHRFFRSFSKAIKRAGLTLNGLLINFDKTRVGVPALGKNWVCQGR